MCLVMAKLNNLNNNIYFSMARKFRGSMCETCKKSHYNPDIKRKCKALKQRLKRSGNHQNTTVANEQFLYLNPQPIVLVIGENKADKHRLFKDILSNQMFYSKKFGRILYIGQTNYESQIILQHQQNWLESCSYQQLMKMIDYARKDKIKNMLIVFNTINMTPCIQTILKVIESRYGQLSGTISLIINVDDINSVPEQILEETNTIFCFKTKYLAKICNKFRVSKSNLQDKQDKDCYVFGQKKAQVYTVPHQDSSQDQS